MIETVLTTLLLAAITSAAFFAGRIHEQVRHKGARRVRCPRCKAMLRCHEP